MGWPSWAFAAANAATLQHATAGDFSQAPLRAEAKALRREVHLVLRQVSFDYERMRRDLRYFPRIVAALNFNISRILGERLADVMGAGHEAKPSASTAEGRD